MFSIGMKCATRIGKYNKRGHEFSSLCNIDNQSTEEFLCFYLEMKIFFAKFAVDSMR